MKNAILAAVLGILFYEYYYSRPTAEIRLEIPKEILFCPSFIPAEVGRAVQQHFDPSFPLSETSATKKEGKGMVLSEKVKNSLTKYHHHQQQQQGELIQYRNSHGRFAGQPIEEFMMNWFPAEFSRAIIIDPPVIFVGPEAGVEVKTDLALLYAGKEIILINTDLETTTTTSATNAEKLLKDQEIRHLKGLTRISSVNCTASMPQKTVLKSGDVFSVLNRTLLKSKRVSRAEYHKILGVSLHWIDSCFEITGSSSMTMKPNIDHITCDIALEGDKKGIGLTIGDSTRWLPAGSFIDISVMTPNNLIFHPRLFHHIDHVDIQTVNPLTDRLTVSFTFSS